MLVYPKSIESLTIGLDSAQKTRLKAYLRGVASEYDRRNFDSDLREMVYHYATESSRKAIEAELHYLRNLKSSKDGKFFSQGVKSYEKLREGVFRFTESNWAPFRWARSYRRAYQKVLKSFKGLNLKPLVYSCDDDVHDALPKDDSHAGYYAILTGKRCKGDNIDGILKEVESIEKEVRNGKKNFGLVMLVFCRTQGNGKAYDDEGNRTGDCDHKSRPVLGVDMRQIVIELRYAKPIQEAMAEMDWYAGGKDFRTDLHRIVCRARCNSKFWFSLDYSHFDTSISRWLIQDAFEIIRSAFSEVDIEVFNAIVESFISKEILLDDCILHSDKGVPSGSMFTQIVDSIVNALVIETYLASQGETAEYIILGDDNLCFTDREIDLTNFSTYVGKNFGMEINQTKFSQGSRSEDPEFLSRCWSLTGQYREKNSLIAKMFYPERRRNYDQNHAKVEEVLYAYILTYRQTMEEIIDVRKFYADYPDLTRADLKSLAIRRILPGSLQFIVDYTLTGIRQPVKRKRSA